jgi:uncharacterized protein (DUF58 family)
MTRNRIWWLLAWLGSLVFLIFYRQWLAWLVLGGVVLVPVFSLLVSLPAMVTSRLEVPLPQRLASGTEARLSLDCKSPLITPAWGCRVQVTNLITGKTHRLRPGDLLPTEHCGTLLCKISRPRVCDYLGLFCLPLHCQREHRVIVEPRQVPMENPWEADADTAFSWKPKKDGFSENHELRLYAPGDSLRQIHWKLSAKTGKLIIREPMVPDPGRVLVQLELKGSADQLDRLLGRCLWLSRRLLEQGIPFELLCLSGQGAESFRVDTAAALEQAMDTLLQRPVALTGALPELTEAVTKQYIIGGAADET